LAEEPSLRCVVVPVTPFAQNSSIVWSPRTGRGAVVDPGGETPRLLGAARANNVEIEKILVTHGHLDHAGAVADLAAELGVPVEGPHRDEAFWIDQLASQGARYGMDWCKSFTPDRWLDDGDTVEVGGEPLAVIHCPGHTPGHVVFFHEEARIALVGDVLFRGSIGRTDFPRGNHGDLLRSIATKLWPLGEDVTFVPGHGPLSTFGDERRSNPFVADRVLQEVS
jgi:glyoxylase-like metal-dependent hydrolase (beta-lactamase superfamily II)